MVAALPRCPSCHPWWDPGNQGYQRLVSYKVGPTRSGRGPRALCPDAPERGRGLPPWSTAGAWPKPRLQPRGITPAGLPEAARWQARLDFLPFDLEGRASRQPATGRYPRRSDSRPGTAIFAGTASAGEYHACSTPPTWKPYRSQPAPARPLALWSALPATPCRTHAGRRKPAARFTSPPFRCDDGGRLIAVLEGGVLNAQRVGGPPQRY